MRLAEIASGDAPIHSFKNAVFSAPTSFLTLLSLRQVVRLACFAAASPADAEAGGLAAAGVWATGVWGAGVWDAGVWDAAG
jgi:hypothetical protein